MTNWSDQEVTSPPVAVFAATGRLGQVVVRQLLSQGIGVIAIARDPVKLAALPSPALRRVADLTKPGTIKETLQGAAIIVSCANAIHVPALLNNLPGSAERVVVMGSTRRFSKVPDVMAKAVFSAEDALEQLDVPSVLLLSTMIYGGGDSVIDAWARLVRRYPILPVPAGRKSRLQPIHIEDVARAIVAATQSPQAPGTPIVVAGAESLTQKEMIRRIALAMKRSVLLVPVPAGFIEIAAYAAGILPGLTRPAAAARRLVEDRTFDLTAMHERLGITPRALDLGFLKTEIY